MSKNVIIHRKPHGYFDGGLIAADLFPALLVSPSLLYGCTIVRFYEK